MYLFTVEEIYNTSSGLILTPAPARDSGKVSVGAGIKLVFPDKSEARTIIKGIVFEFNHIAIPREWADRVGPGVEVWTIDE